MAATQREDYYAVLEVEYDADATAIRTSYLRLAKTRHPDKQPGNSHATGRFQLLEAAYYTLSDPQLRAKYDRSRPRSENRGPWGNPSAASPCPAPTPTKKTRPRKRPAEQPEEPPPKRPWWHTPLGRLRRSLDIQQQWRDWAQDAYDFRHKLVETIQADVDTLA
ncbi:uncharacterized protein DNG_06804 [Cephalotrichum gorgonifer]|uniref:J domain-containing protein n=1 Tax=Cephalotrichum gorgonifer TaxID=2041049 RepID=A0AAE8N0G6_9PEZI|nr:uncharacterized protein DNG_06804 [Cephalotrichum gorgonifer]